ncbi:inorganic phosphate transporter [Vagococcus intermedius]|uniref:Inorganic phosphate transporter n=1 Tax=Vagococcus intermedius TaxID=2991418 RepID=A0AAF0CU60_9ENTE|nr:inorganic phosphate transporter [Vagococcus intermedius]WEG72936.1 inorganic phosphate transporter [Vagococcus intermedius]WEG75023.1 inorganic phosphate transporter [Vagococcus intermedius]
MNAALIITLVLTMGVIFVNGFTDAPNSIATAISTKALKPKTAIWIAAVMCFLGAFTMTLINAEVAETISNIVSFHDGTGTQARIALMAALFSIVTWAVTAWWFGIPTSESHALVAGLTGSAMALGGLDAVNANEWVKVGVGLLVSTVIGFGGGWLLTRLIQFFVPNPTSKKNNKFFKGWQIFGAVLMSFMHGMQDGQKFMGVFMLGLYYNGLVSMNDGGGFTIPIWVMILCSITIGLGVSFGGTRIIENLGDMAEIDTYQGFSADLTAALALLGAGLFGIPMSTTQTKTTAIMGVGAAKDVNTVKWSTAKEMVFAWILTFPGCLAIAYLITKVFLVIL